MTLETCTFNDLPVKDMKRYFMPKDEGTWYCVKMDNQIVGVLGVSILGILARINVWFVQSAYQSQGIGTFILNEFVSQAQGLGVRKVIMVTNQTDLVKSLGWDKPTPGNLMVKEIA